MREFLRNAHALRKKAGVARKVEGAWKEPADRRGSPTKSRVVRAEAFG